MIPLEVRLIVVFVIGAILGSLVNWAVHAFAWQPRPVVRTGFRPLFLKVGLGIALAALYWWEVERLGLIHDQRAVIPRPRRPPDAGLLTIVEGEAEKIAEGGEGSLGRIASVSASLRALSCASPRVDPLPSPRSRSASTR